MFIIICLGSQNAPLLQEQYSLFSGCVSSKEKHGCRLSFILLCAFYSCPGITLKEVSMSLDGALGSAQQQSTAGLCLKPVLLSLLLLLLLLISYKQSPMFGVYPPLSDLYRHVHPGPNPVSRYFHLNIITSYNPNESA